MSDIIIAIGVGGDVGVYKLTFDSSASTLVESGYITNTSIASNFTATLVQQSPVDNQFYVAGNYTGGKTRIYKMDSDLTIDSTWGGGTGYAEFDCTLSSPSSADKPYMYIGANGNILIGGYETAATNPVNLVDSSGTLLWQGKAWDNNGNRDVIYTKGGLILPNGNVVIQGNVGTGEKPLCVMAESNGGYVNSYSPTLGASGMGSGSLAISKSGHLYAGQYASNNSNFYKISVSDFSSVEFTETSVDCTFDYPMTTAHSNGDIYTGRRYNAGLDTFIYRLSGKTGTIVNSYNAGYTALGSCELPSGNVFYSFSSGVPRGRVLGEDLTPIASASLTHTPSFFYSPSSVPAPIITSSTPTDLNYSRRLVAFSGDSAYYESAAGTMTEVTEKGGGLGQPAASSFDMTKSLTAAEAYQKIFVANNATIAVVDFMNDRVSCNTAIVSDYIPDHGDILHQGASSSVVMITDTVLSTAKTLTAKVTTGTINTGANILDANDNIVMATSNTISVLNSVPFMYNYTPMLRAATAAAFSGSMPEKATLVCRYRGRIVLSGNPDYPFQWYMARQANPFDWLYFVNDAQSPVAGGNADAGEIGDVIQALIPKGDDFLIFGCSNSIWLMRGDPAAGGSLDELTSVTGIYGPRSWCIDDVGNLYFWGRNGVYRMPPNFSGIENLTATTLPDIVNDEAPNKETHRIVFAYDRVRQVVCIFITKMDDGTNSNYIFDIRTQGFFPESYPDELAVFSAYFYDAIDPDYQKLYLGSRDSYLRNFDDDKKNDAGYSGDEAIDSYAVIGPAQIGPDADMRGRLKTLSITTGTDTDGVDYDIHVADTAEEVVDDIGSGTTPLHTGTIASGNRVQTLRPRSRGAWIGIKLQNATVDETWQFEKVVCDIVPAGDIK